MTYYAWFSFFLIAFLAAVSPGPGAILTISNGLNYGYRKTIITIIGQETAVALIVIIVGLGYEFIAASSKLFLFIKIIGATWLIFLGFTKIFIIFPPPAIKKTDKMMLNPVIPFCKNYITGFLTDITNVKTWAFMLSTIPQFIDIHKTLWKQTIVMTITMVVVDTIMMSIYGLCASYMKKFLLSKKVMNIQNMILGSFLIILGMSILLFLPDLQVK